MPGNHGIKTGIPLSNKHRIIVKKYLTNVDFDKIYSKKEKNDIVLSINFIFEKENLIKIYSVKKFDDWRSNKKYRKNLNIKNIKRTYSKKKK